MHNQESVQKNETHEILWDCEIQTDHLISTRRLELVLINKKKDFGLPADHRVKIKENENIGKY